MRDDTDQGRRLRPKEKKQYDFDGVDDDDIEGKRTFSLEDKLQSSRYNKKLLKEIKGSELNIRYFQENGFKSPMVIKDKTGLGMRIPSENFSVNDVKQCVGSRRMIDCMDVTTQKAIEMSMKEWVRYYETEDRERLLNVISLEFSGTRLENYVEQPEIVRNLDWVDNVWPWYYKESQTESTNVMERMKYPKVQKYCLMSVKGCYTDFHIDMGGTSVWYHILKGKKVFWLIPPTEENLSLYEQWTLSGKQGDNFFADRVADCQRVALEPGWTFFIPTGWIHAVFTPEDSLVFGGNFLHTFNISMQLRVWEVESNTHVPGKFRYPFFTSVHWYLLERYVSVLKNKQHRVKSQQEMDMERRLEEEEERFTRRYEAIKAEEDNSDAVGSSPRSSLGDEHAYMCSPQHIYSGPCSPQSCPASPKSRKSSSSSSTTSEVTKGLKTMRKKWHGSDTNLSKEDLKDLIKPVSVKLENCLLQDKGKLLNAAMLAGNSKKPWVHMLKSDLDGLRRVIKWLKALPSNKRQVPKDIADPDALLQDAEAMADEHDDDDQHLAITGEFILKCPTLKANKMKVRSYLPRKPRGSGARPKSTGGGPRRRRVRCRKCEPCTRPDCRECVFCKDMKKYGGPGRMKQSCFCRQCIAPVLPRGTVCILCGKDEPVDEGSGEATTTLMECGVCWDIVHPRCLREKHEDLNNEGMMNEDLPNSWECPKCCREDQQELANPRMSKGMAKSKRVDSISTGSDNSSETSHLPNGSTSAVAGSVREHGSPMCVSDITDDPKPSTSRSSPEPVRRKRPGRKPASAQNESVSSSDKIRQAESPTLSGSNASTPSQKVSPTTNAAQADVGSEPSGGGSKEVSPESASSTPKRGRQKAAPDSAAKEKKKGRMAAQEKSPAPSPDVKIRKRKVVSEDSPRRRGRKQQEGEGDTSPPSKRMRGIRKTSRSPLSPLRKRQKVGTGRGGQVLSPVAKEPKSLGGSKDAVTSPTRHTACGRETGGPGDGDGNHGSQSHDAGDGESTEDGWGTGPGVPGGNKGGDEGGAGSSKTVSEVPLSTQLVQELQHKFVVRPAPIPPPPTHLVLENGSMHVLNKDLWMHVFMWMRPRDLAMCMQVCKTLYRWCGSSKLWHTIDLCRCRIRQAHLLGIVRRQPANLDLSWTNVSRRQLEWLVARLPHLKSLVLAGNSWPAISALCSSICPLLSSLDLSWVAGIYDNCVDDLVSPPKDRRPGVNDLVSRLDRCTRLSLAGSDISGTSLTTITHYLHQLTQLNLSYCSRITNEDLNQLASATSSLPNTLTLLNLTGCSRLTNEIFTTLLGFPKLSKLIVQACPNITTRGCDTFIQNMWDTHNRKLSQVEEKWLVQE